MKEIGDTLILLEFVLKHGRMELYIKESIKREEEME
jgi:hypothetical protein